MIVKSAFSELKEITNFVTVGNDNYYNYKEKNEKPPQKKALLMVKRGRKISKINTVESKVHNRDSPDNIRRKVKTHFHNFIIALLNMKAKQYLKKDEKFGKIAFKITQDLSVGFNQKLFKTKIKDIIIEMSDKYSDKNRNKLILNKIMENVDKNNELISLLNLNYEELYLDYYLKSNKENFKGEKEDESYEAHIEKLKKIFGNKYAKDFNDIAESLITFFYNCKKREPKRKLKAPSFANICDSVINYDEHKSSTDRQTQTDIYFSGDEDTF